MTLHRYSLPVPVPEAAQRLLSSLDPSPTAIWTFQTFEDRPEKHPKLNSILHGAFAEHADRLTLLNARGAGVFVMVNEGDAKGRKAKNVIRVRAVFVDIDAGGTKRLQQIIETSMQVGRPPSAVIQTSPNRFSIFWCVSGCELEQFGEYQRRLAVTLGGDPSVCDLPRVMRLPGFVHNKRTPYPSELIHVRNAEYDAAELIAALCPKPGPKAPAMALPLPDDQDQWTDAIAAADAGIAEGGRNHGIFRACCALRAQGESRAVAAERAQQWAKRCTPPLDEAEALRCVDSAFSPQYLQADAQRSGIDDDAASELQRLATLGPLAYDREREKAAKALSIRVSTLDEVVDQYRPLSSQDDAARKLLGDAADPEPWPDTVDGAALLERMEQRFTRHARLPKHAATVMATWCLATWCLDAFTVFPFLRLHSATPGCGKSTVLDIIERLCRRPFRGDSASAAVVFRLVDATQCSILLDEAETLFGDQGNESLRGILNGGHGRAGAALRIAGEGKDMTPVRFSTWGPKAFAHLRRLPSTITDRSIAVNLVRAMPNDRPERIRDNPEWLELRRMALRWSTDYHEQLRETALSDPPDFLPNRVGDNWQPLIAVATLAGGDGWQSRILDAAKQAITESSLADSQEAGIALIAGIRRIFDEGSADALASSEILSALTADPESRWTDFSHGRPLTPRKLAQILSDFQIRPASVRLNSVNHGSGQRTPKGYRRTQFEDAWRRYLPAEEDE